ncbi:protein-glutamine gamma-glutamyltransferase 2 isoform X2 [Larimichthys crocea]|uniref:protein-glutamine gamma-glutamyltransferase 2 isoform X2 n=1 Tax=Larimichthys crocea TaxID=215358 RepID=UPI000F5EF33C|nr:protein-glutamine gamma-glutamyltransferase 2 isoform X2 [Larimichthys crocea]
MDYKQQTMDYKQHTQQNICGTGNDHCRLKYVNFEVAENTISHETQGLSKDILVVRRGKPFKITLMFTSDLWDPRTERLVLEVCLGNMSEKMPVQFSDKCSNPGGWSANIYHGDMHLQSGAIHICSPVLSAVGMYDLFLHIESSYHRRSYAVGSFVLLCNPWLKDDSVYMPQTSKLEEYIKSDYGQLYMGSHLNISMRPWSFGQYEPGVLEACLQLLQVSPQHHSDKNSDYIRRVDPVYISKVICAMVNCNDDLGILKGKWQGTYKDGVKPTEWSGSADILHQWVSSKCRPVRYGQCWVFASVLCTVMRVLGVPSRVVTVFNAAHDGNGNLKIEEYYSTKGEKLSLSKDSIWNFHVWVECWMRRPDLGEEFDGWQVVDPTPQEKSAGIYSCGPCPVAAILQRDLGTPYDTGFVYASVDADIIRLIVRNGQVVGRMEDTKSVGQMICTKSVNSDKPENLTESYKREKIPMMGSFAYEPMPMMMSSACEPNAMRMRCKALEVKEEMSAGLEVSLSINGEPTVGEEIALCVTVTNYSSGSRVLMEHLSAQVKGYNSSPQESFWKTHKEVHIKPGQALMLQHTILPSQYESVLAGDDIVNVAVVIKDVRTKERVLAAQEFSISSPKITIEIEGGDSVHMKKDCTAQVFFINTFKKTLNGAVLTVEGSGLLQGKQEARLAVLQPGDKIEKKVSIMANSPGTKVLMATFSHSNSPSVVCRGFQKVSVTTD